MEKQKNTIKKLIIILIIAIIISAIIFVIIRKGNKSKLDRENINKTSNTQEIMDETYTVNNIENEFEKETEISVESMTVRRLGDQLGIVTTLKNNSSETLDGFTLEIALLDSKGNIITTIAENSSKKVEKKNTIETENYISGYESTEKIDGAKVVELEKGNTADNLDDTFDEMEQE